MKLPTIEDCTFTIEAEQDDCPVRGNALASGDAKLDKQVEDEILARLDNGDIWAWASVRVVCKWKGWEGDDCLSGCSYKDEEDFRKPGGYFDDMKAQAFDDMILNIKTKVEPLCLA